jgi:DNA polymerase elongation subunit (family B)
MGLETIVGQLRPIITDQYISEKMSKGSTFAEAWEGIFGSKEYQAIMDRRQGIDLIIDWEIIGTNDTLTAEECYELIFNSGQPWMLSGNGTIFSYEKDAIIPGLLADWYKDRKSFQKKMHEATDPKERSFYKRRQHVQKILLNSLYGALLSPSCRFYDKRVGQSVTLTGRVICKHMNSFVNECITGEYKIDGDACICADTDSCQFSAWSTLKPMVDRKEIEWNKESAVQLYTAIGEKVNNSFTSFMKQAFHTPENFGNLIKASCESIGYRGLYITKKRYAILNYFFDGEWLKEPKLKAMGLDLRRSDTPVVCQEFLTNVLMEFLKGATEQEIINIINEFKKKFKDLLPAEQGTPKRVNKLTYYSELIQQGKGNRVPGHVRAAINWNLLREINHDRVHTRIVDGMKCVVCPLKDNNMNMVSVAYPVDEVYLPDWFTKLPMDSDHMIATVVDKKIENLFGKLKNWRNIENATKKTTCFDDFFS